MSTRGFITVTFSGAQLESRLPKLIQTLSLTAWSKGIEDATKKYRREALSWFWSKNQWQ